SGDILLFTVGSGSKTASFRVVEIQDGSFQKGGLSSNLLIPTEKNIAIFPNPFNPTTTFRVSLPEPTNVRLSVYNMLGQHVATVVDGEVQAGHNDFRFNGSSLSSGIYFYRLEMGKEVKSGKLMLLK
ncbi:MAG: T9SS type A sorting domain-containing protein, partial [Bacteroidota bacterium]